MGRTEFFFRSTSEASFMAVYRVLPSFTELLPSLGLPSFDGLGSKCERWTPGSLPSFLPSFFSVFFYGVYSVLPDFIGVYLV